MKKEFSTKKKAVLCIVIAAVLVVAAIALGTSVALIKSSGKQAAMTAMADAGVRPADVADYQAHLEFDDGRFLYEVEFYHDGVKYEYKISAKDGKVLSRDVDGAYAGTGGSGSGNSGGNTSGNNGSTGGNGSGNAEGAGNGATWTEGQYIGMEKAKEIALKHANVTAQQARFVKEQLDNDDGRMEYELEFYVDRTEYDYSIDAATGDILGYDVDKL